MKTSIAAIAAVLLASLACRATDARESISWSGFYPRPVLEQAAADLSPGILANWQEVILPALTAEERAALARVRFVVDLEYTESAVNFYAENGKVHIPASSTRLLGDLVAAWMWLDRNGKSTETVNEYLAILKYQWGSGRLHSERYLPLDALGVPADVRNDPAIAADYATVISSALFFVMGHELGHVLYGHRGIEVKSAADSARSIQQERAADAFALDLMGRIGAVPVGVPLLFMVWTALDSFPGDPGHGVPSSHPHSSKRLRVLAATLRDQAGAFASKSANPAAAVTRVRQIADLLDNGRTDPGSVFAALESDGVKDLWRQKGQKGRLQDLKPRARYAGLAALSIAPTQRDDRPFHGSYSGKWISQSADGKTSDFDVQMELTRTGEKVSGSWTFGPNRVAVTGDVVDGSLYFNWAWGTDYRGRGLLNPAPDGRLAGTWGYNRNPAGAGAWSLARP